MFSCKQGKTSDSNIAKKIFRWKYFCNNYKDYYKIGCSKECFVIISGDVPRQEDRRPLHSHYVG